MIEITLTDIRDARQILGACLTLVTAHDIMEAQARLQPHRPSALGMEIERVKTRMDSYVADYLLGLEDAEEEEGDNGNVIMGGPEPDFEDSVLADQPLGAFDPPRQAGRILTPQAVRAGAPTAAIEVDEVEDGE